MKLQKQIRNPLRAIPCHLEESKNIEYLDITFDLKSILILIINKLEIIIFS